MGHIMSKSNQEPLRIWKRKDADFIPTLQFLGSMDEIRISNRALDEKEVKQVYKAR